MASKDTRRENHENVRKLQGIDNQFVIKMLKVI